MARNTTCNRCKKLQHCKDDHDGFPYCNRCYEELSRTTCTVCSKGIRYTSTLAPEFCHRCAKSQRWKGKTCHRCSRTALVGGLVKDGYVYCGSCRVHVLDMQICPYCGCTSKYVFARRSLGLDLPACSSCARKHLPHCEVCNARRLLIGVVEGRRACAGCVQRGTLLDGICSRCEKYDTAPDTPYCQGCQNLRLAQIVRRNAMATLKQPWVQSLFATYTEDAGIQTIPGQIVTLMRRNVEGFQLLDRSLSSEAELTVESVLQAFAAEAPSQRFRSIKQWLGAARGLDFNGEEALLIRHRQRVNRVLASSKNAWIRTELELFYARIWQRRTKMLAAKMSRGSSPMTLESILLAIKYAAWLLDACHVAGATSAQSITQTMLDTYVAEHERTFHTLGAFIRHLNRSQRRFQPLELPPRRRARSTIHLRMTHVQRVDAVRHWLAASGNVDLRNASVALLCMFYLQKPGTVLALRRQHLRRDGDSVSLDFGQGFEEIDPDIATVLTRWLDAWHHHSRFKAIAKNDFLFPGNRTTCAYSTTAFGTWLRKTNGINLPQLFATAVHGLIEAGLEDLSTMSRVYGVRPSTAIRYWKDAGADVATFLYKEAIETMRENGDFDDLEC